MAQMMEEVTFERPVKVILIPDGIEMEIPEGERGWITQVLGGHYTVQLETGRLVRVADRDGEAIGREPVASPWDGEVDPDAVVTEEQVWDQLRTCYDPEIPLDIVELGLVYTCRIEDHPDGGSMVFIEMTLTAPGCGMGQVLADDVAYKVRTIPGVRDVQVEIVFDPPWSPDMMSEAGRLELGMFW